MLVRAEHNFCAEPFGGVPHARLRFWDALGGPRRAQKAHSDLFLSFVNMLGYMFISNLYWKPFWRFADWLHAFGVISLMRVDGCKMVRLSSL